MHLVLNKRPSEHYFYSILFHNLILSKLLVWLNTFYDLVRGVGEENSNGMTSTKS